MSALTPEQVERLLSCECGHDIGGEHNSNGCYHIDWSANRKCECLLTDGQDEHALLGQRVADMLAEQREAIAAELTEMGPVWGGDEPWLTTGNKVSRLAARIASGAP